MKNLDFSPQDRDKLVVHLINVKNAINKGSIPEARQLLDDVINTLKTMQPEPSVVDEVETHTIKGSITPEGETFVKENPKEETPVVDGEPQDPKPKEQKSPNVSGQTFELPEIMKKGSSEED